jgi:hypothetical protein
MFADKNDYMPMGNEVSFSSLFLSLHKSLRLAQYPPISLNVPLRPQKHDGADDIRSAGKPDGYVESRSTRHPEMLLRVIQERKGDGLAESTWKHDG